MYSVVASHQFSAIALYWASRNGHLQVVRLLLGRGSEVECRQEVRVIISFAVDSVALSIVAIVVKIFSCSHCT